MAEHISEKDAFFASESVKSQHKADFRSLFNALPCAYIALWPDLTVIDASNAYLMAMGTELHQLTDTLLWDTAPFNKQNESTVSLIAESLNFILKNKVTHSLSLQRIDVMKSNRMPEEKYWNMTNTPVLDAENEVLYILIKVEEVTDFVYFQKEQITQNKSVNVRGLMEMEMEIMRRSMEVQQRNEDLAKRIDEGTAELVRASKDVLDYKYALEVSTIVSITDSKGKIQHVNENFCTISKYSAEELKGKDHRVVNSGHHSKEFFRKLWTTITDGKVWKGEIQNQAKDGSIYWVDTTIVPFLNENGKPYKFLSIHNDVTRKKQAFQKIKVSESNYKDLFENSAVSIFVSDAIDAKPIAVNSVGARTFGYKSRRNFIDTFRGEWHYVTPVEIQKNIEMLKETGELINEVQEMKKLDGTHFWVNANVKLNTEKNLLYTFLIDITKEMQLKSEVDLKVKELESKNKELEVFNYISTHDLQEPLRKIQNLISILMNEEKARLSKQGKEYLKAGYETSQRMRNLLNDLLLYSRIKNLSYSFKETDLHSIVKDVLKDFQQVIKKSNATIELVTNCEIKIIPFQFQQVIYNLISNALKFTLPGVPPYITIKCRTVSGRHVTVPKLQPKLKYSHITISDNGIGFDPQYKERIFEVFQRLNTIEKYDGTGIGLAICKKIIENHNGVIVASGKVNQGARFDIYIPAVQNKT